MVHKIIAHFLGDMHMCWKRKQGLNKTTLPHEIMGIHNCTQRFMHSCDNTPASSHIESCIHGTQTQCLAKVLISHKEYLSEVLTWATKVGCYTNSVVSMNALNTVIANAIENSANGRQSSHLVP
jgi:hypothetical protein